MDFSSFTPNQQILENMMAMGIAKHVAEIALYNTGNECCDAAVSYVFDNPESSSFNLPIAQESRTNERRRRVKKKTSKAGEDSGENEENEADDEGYASFKMVFVVNSSLEMGMGKIASQVAHACLGLFRILQRVKEGDDLEAWEDDGEKKVVLMGVNQLHLTELNESATTLGLTSYMVKDAGRTEIAPGSHTVLAIFGKEEIVDSVTGDLTLLK